VKAYEDAYAKLIKAGQERVEAHEECDHERLRTFLALLRTADRSLHHLLEHCHRDVKYLIEAAIEELAKALDRPIIETWYRDPYVWIRDAIEAVKDAAKRDVRRDLGPI
jgi:hypothetical protein